MIGFRGNDFVAVTALVLLFSVVPAVHSAEHRTSVPLVTSFPEGVHRIPSVLMLEEPHAVLEGKGRGVTILVAPRGVRAIGPDCIVRDLTIVGEGTGVGLLLQDSWSASVENVEIENFQTGIAVELSSNGRRLAGGPTMNGWPGALTRGRHWGSRVTLTNIRNVEITGPGDGIVLRNLLKNSAIGDFNAPTNDRLIGEFFTGTTIWGGHIKVDGTALIVGDGVWNTKVIGAYIDVGAGGGVIVEHGARWLNLIGTNLDLSSTARAKGTPKIRASQRSVDTILIEASDELRRADIVVVEP